MDSIDREERILRITNVEEQDHGLYRCVRGDITLNEILLDVLSKFILLSFSKSIDKLIYICMKTFVCTSMFVLYHILVLIVIRVHFDNANMSEVCVCVCMLTDLLSFRVLLIHIYTYIYIYIYI